MYNEKSRSIDAYLACPYTHHDESVSIKRFSEVTKMAAWMTKMGICVFSPITHSHIMAQAYKLPTTWEFWGPIDRCHMDACKVLLVYMLDGYESSIGVTSEIQHARKTGMPIIMFKNKLDFIKQAKEIECLRDKIKKAKNLLKYL